MVYLQIVPVSTSSHVHCTINTKKYLFFPFFKIIITRFSLPISTNYLSRPSNTNIVSNTPVLKLFFRAPLKYIISRQSVTYH